MLSKPTNIPKISLNMFSVLLKNYKKYSAKI